MPESVGIPLVNIVRAKIDDGADAYYFDTAEEAELEPFISEGKEDILRSKTKVLAINKIEDIVVGYNIRLSQSTLVGEVLAMIDGGTYTARVESVSDGTYGPPVAGKVPTRKEFTLYVYTEEKDSSGATVSYAEFKFTKCKGTPVKFEVKNGEFFVPEFTIQSRPGIDVKPFDIKFLDSLPDED